MRTLPSWLTVTCGQAPLILSLPHTGLELPEALVPRLVSPWRARKDADWWVDRLYDFAGELGATIVRTAWSRTVVDVNRHPSGTSLYPGLATTELCPTTTFDGEPLYVVGQAPLAAEIAERRAEAFDPYHAALAAEIARLRARHACVVLYDAHSIRSEIPGLFAGVLPHFNIGTNDGASCAGALTSAVADACATSGLSHVVDGRFKGGYITRHYGRPAAGTHAIQMELACRTYLHEPSGPVTEESWPVAFDVVRAEAARRTLRDVLQACLAFAARSRHHAHAMTDPGPC